MNFHIVDSLEQYEEVVEGVVKLFSNENWFRGHSTAEYRLVPNIYREDRTQFRCNLLGYNSRSLMNPQSGYYHIYQYKIADDITKRKYPKDSFIERMYRNQHYNILTPLLDFSTDPLVALFFAVENHSKWQRKYSTNYIMNEYGDNLACVGKQAGAIFVINPSYLNYKSLGTEKLLDSNVLNKKFILNNNLPFAISPSVLNNPRIKAQSGKFVCFGLKMEPLDFYEVLEKDMTKILIPNAAKQEIFEKLIEKGYTYQKIYPDSEGLAKEANYQMWRDYNNRIKV